MQKIFILKLKKCEIKILKEINYKIYIKNKKY